MPSVFEVMTRLCWRIVKTSSLRLTCQQMWEIKKSKQTMLNFSSQKRSFESLPTLIQNWLMAARLGVRRRWFPFLKEIDAVNLPLKLTFHGPTQQEYLKCRWTRRKPTPLLLVPQYPLKIGFFMILPRIIGTLNNSMGYQWCHQGQSPIPLYHLLPVGLHSQPYLHCIPS